MNDKNENLNELFGRFYDDRQVKDALEDISVGRKLFTDNPAPIPAPALIAQIKGQVEQKLTRGKKARATGHYLKVISAAVAVILVCLVLLQMQGDFHRQTSEPAGNDDYAVSQWQTEDFAESDTDFAVLSAEVEELQEEILSLQLSQNSVDSDNTNELETELMEINSDFWKG